MSSIRRVSLLWLTTIRYPAGPLVAVENTDGKFLHELDVCAECRLKRYASLMQLGSESHC